MTGDKVFYKYYAEYVPEEKIDYSYATYHGEAFIKAWEKFRKKFYKENSDGIPDLIPVSQSPTEILFISWIEKQLNNQIDFKDEFNLLIKRFEVTKKIYSNYSSNFRPLDKNEFKEYRLYCLFACLLVLAYSIEKKFQFLNALLKVNDINCSLYDKLSGMDKRILYFCISKEQQFVLDL
jgi:hypothetical protein